jgi:hypothetical protein
VVLADVNHYRVNELQAADRTLQQIVEFYITKARKSGLGSVIRRNRMNSKRKIWRRPQWRARNVRTHC